MLNKIIIILSWQTVDKLFSHAPVVFLRDFVWKDKVSITIWKVFFHDKWPGLTQEEGNAL